jgi:hypothetical protein
MVNIKLRRDALLQNTSCTFVHVGILRLASLNTLMFTNVK